MNGRRRDERGLSALEVVVAAAFAATAAIPVLGAMHKSVESDRAMMAREQAEERVRRVGHRIRHYLRTVPAAAVETLPVWPDTAGRLEYERAESFDVHAGREQNPVVRRAEALEFADGELWLASGPSKLRLATGVAAVAFAREGTRLVACIVIETALPDGKTIALKRRFHVQPRE